MKQTNNPDNTKHNTRNIPDLDIIDLDKDSFETWNEGAVPDRKEEAPDCEEEDEEESGKQRPQLSFLIHIGFAAILVLIVFLAVNRIRNFGNVQNLSDYEGNKDLEVLDHILPLIPKDGVEVVDDGQTTIVAFGNSPFADDRDSENNLLNMIEEMTGATVYNCSVGDSFLAAENPTLAIETAHKDAFNFYWLTTAFCLRNNDYLYEWIFDELEGQLPADGLESYETLMNIDFNTVDVIVLMYDGSDYLAGHGMYRDENDTDIQTFTGNMCAGIDLIQEFYPHIRIIVMSPTYAFAINDEGEYVSSDQVRYNDQDVLSTYVIKQFGYSYDREVTFIDNIYGTITEDNAKEYLTDNIHLNVEGRRKVAERFVYALTYYDEAE
ncbi:MAG: SGNH/GDSL hydrolase family protein [Lachnospiraceae bacterium]|nr:SGNH/GDSL hydrolase family protein [Lachnospiraceae bacterium]